MIKKYKIFGTVHHIMHQTRLVQALRDDAEFYLCYNSWRQWQDKRFLKARPIPDNIKFVTHYEPKTYDFAILHIDQQICNPQILGKATVYQEFNDCIQDIPKVVINHGSPYYPEFLKLDKMTDKDAEDEARRIVKDKVGGNLMVVNSHQAAKEWGWGYPIVHGYNLDDFWDLPKEPRIFTALSPAGLDYYYNRECLNEVSKLLEEQTGQQIYWAKVNCLQDGNFDEYRDFLGRSLIYFDPSYLTPMNGARTEAMLSGACIVQVEGAHDLERFARNTENMVIAPNKPQEIVKILLHLLEENPEEAKRIGQKGKETARDLFNLENYRRQWLDFIHNELKI